MSSLGIHRYDKNRASIIDLRGDITISDEKWLPLFTHLGELFENIYFSGERKWVEDADFKTTMNYLCNKMLWQSNEDYKNVLYKVNSSSIRFNRRLMAKMWEYYEFPTLIFLDDKKDEILLRDFLQNKMGDEAILDNINNCVLISRKAQVNVIWIEANFDLTFFLSSLNSR